MVATDAPILNQFLKELEARAGQKHDAPGTPTTTGFAHGPTGILDFPGVDPVMFHAIMGAQSMLGQLPTVPSLFTDPTFLTLTGVTDETGTEPAGLCDPGPEAGTLKSCVVTAPFGRYKRQTQEIEIDRVGQRTDRADPMDLTLVGQPLAENVFATGPQSVTMTGEIFANEVAKRIWERNVAFHRLLSRQLWIATPNNNNAGGGYREFAGFDALINTGYVDADNNQACPAMDSFLMDFNHQRIDLAGGGDSIVEAITSLYYEVKDRAIRTGVMPVRWVFAMRPQLFYEITSIWPCSYLTYRCQVAGNERVNVEGSDSVELRDKMRAGRYLLIDGEQIPVIVDDGIAEDTDAENANVPAGCFGTDIYLIPMSVVGGRSVTFLEHFQYQNPAVETARQNMVLAEIEGAFITWPVQTRGCFQLESKIEPRLIFRTPWLAGRLQNVVYCPVQHTRDAFPDEGYFVDGGRVSRPGPSFFNIWSS